MGLATVEESKIAVGGQKVMRGARCKMAPVMHGNILV